MGNDHLSENWAYSPRVLKVVSFDVPYHKEHEYIYSLGVGIYVVSEILDH